MVTIVQMILSDSYKIRDIDRSETIELTYKLKNGVLEEIKSPHECSRWKEDIYLEIISRYEDMKMNSATVVRLLEHLTEINWWGLVS